MRVPGLQRSEPVSYKGTVDPLVPRPKRRHRTDCWAAPGKRRYSSESQAVRSLENRRQSLPLRVYWCRACNGYHHTSQPKR